MAMRKSIKVFGKIYPSIKDACDSLGCNYITITKRISTYKWPINKAFSYIDDAKKTEITVDGVVYDSIKSACIAKNIPYNRVTYRLRQGWTIEKVFDHKDHNKRAIVVNGNTYDTITEAAKALKLNKSTAKWRLYANKKLEAPVGKQLIIHGRVYKSIASASRRFKICNTVVSKRLIKGWKVEDAIIKSAKPRWTKRSIGYVYVICNSINDKKYIGVTVNKPDRRFQQHLNSANYGRTKMAKAIRTLGVENFSYYVVAKTKVLHELPLLERGLIEKFNSIEQGYNSNGGGTIGSWHIPKWITEAAKIAAKSN